MSEMPETGGAVYSGIFPPAKGVLSVINIPAAYNGKYVFISGAAAGNTPVYGAAGVMYGPGSFALTAVFALIRIENGAASVPLYTQIAGADFAAFEGSGKGSLLIDILDSVTGTLPYREIVTLPLNSLVSTSARVTFSGGDAVVNGAEWEE
jgi:hypothetical protein